MATINGQRDILASAGPGDLSRVSIFDGITRQALDTFFAYGPGFRGGVFVGGG